MVFQSTFRIGFQWSDEPLAVRPRAFLARPLTRHGSHLTTKSENALAAEAEAPALRAPTTPHSIGTSTVADVT